MSENSLTGAVDPRFGQMARMGELYCSRNHLTGRIPPEVSRLTRLQILMVRPESGLGGGGG